MPRNLGVIMNQNDSEMDNIVDIRRMKVDIKSMKISKNRKVS